MTTPQQVENLVLAYHSALIATELATPWDMAITPEKYAACAACEAMAETLWLTEMPPNSRNCLGIKAGRGYVGKVVQANGTEQNADGSWTTASPDIWRVYEAYAACFYDQIKILHSQKNSDGSLAYQAALNAPTPDAYILAECARWSTGQAKGAVVLQIYHAHKDVLA